MRYYVLTITMLVSSVSAIPFDSLRSRDTGICGNIGNSCHAEDAACCTGQVGFAFCNVDDKMIEFQSCDINCGVGNQGIVVCTVPN